MENILSYQPETETIRQVPQNYCIATKSKGYWMIDFDIAADQELVLRVAKALFDYEARYGDGLNLLSKITPNSEFKEPEKTVLELAKELDFNFDYEYFDYISDSITNGQKKQAKKLWKDLSSEDKKNALEYYRNTYTEHGYLRLLEFIVNYQVQL